MIIYCTLSTLWRSHDSTNFLSKLASVCLANKNLNIWDTLLPTMGWRLMTRKSRLWSLGCPTSISDLRGYLGLTGYYQIFFWHYGILGQPLTNLLKKEKFGWHDEVEAAFVAIKKAMITIPILAMPNFNQTFTIETDTSRYGIGVVLTQNGWPIAYMSRELGVTKWSLSIYVKEILAILEAIRIWCPYLLGSKFYIQTDQCSLKHLLEQCIVTP